jgi:hypothetical protein
MNAERCPRCVRCGELIIGPRTIGAAAVPSIGWVCGFDASPAEHAEYLQRLLDNASAW